MHVKFISGYDLVHLQKCVDWLEPFRTVINEQGIPARHKHIEGVTPIEGVAPEYVHNIQVNVVTTTMLQQVVELCELQVIRMDMGTSIAPLEES